MPVREGKMTCSSCHNPRSARERYRWDAARWQHFRDLRNGVFLDRFRFDRELASGWLVQAAADNVGYRDQRSFAQFERPGKLRAAFEWNQVSLFTSQDTRQQWTHGCRPTAPVTSGRWHVAHVCRSVMVFLRQKKGGDRRSDRRPKEHTRRTRMGPSG